MTRVLELEGVTCRFTDGDTSVTAVDNISLTAARGEMVAVMGPSGSGKSTLVHLACGLVSPHAGKVSVLGQPVPGTRGESLAARWLGRSASRRRWADLRRHTIGVVHQRLNLVPALDAVDNVALPLRLAGTPRGPALAAAGQALAEVDASDLAHKTIERLSTGEQQRVALARAIVGQRQLVLADEPTAALDTAGAERIAKLLASAAHAGRAVLMVTHDSRLATWADRVIVLRDGKLVETVGEPARGYSADEVAAP